MSDDVVEINDKGLRQLIAALGGVVPTARVGVLGDHTMRNAAAPGQPTHIAAKAKTNAEVLIAAEFGTTHTPIRSVLRMPLTLKLNEYLERSGAFDEDTFKRVLSAGTLKPWAERAGLVALDVVHDAFKTCGFGQWKASDMRRKKNHETLIETNQLQKSISTDVV